MCEKRREAKRRNSLNGNMLDRIGQKNVFSTADKVQMIVVTAEGNVHICLTKEKSLISFSISGFIDS